MITDLSTDKITRSSSLDGNKNMTSPSSNGPAAASKLKPLLPHDAASITGLASEQGR